MSSTKKWLAALLAAVLVFGNVVYALSRPLHAEEAEQEAPVEEVVPEPAAEPAEQSEPEIVIEVVEQTPAEEPATVEQPQEPAPAAEPEEKPVEAKAPEAAPETVQPPAESTKPETTAAPAESAKPEATKAPEETAKPEATEKPIETAKYTFYGTDGEIVLEKEYKLGETASAPADYRPGEVSWFVKGTDNEFKNTAVNDCSPVEVEARENAAPAEDAEGEADAPKTDKAETPADGTDKAEADDVSEIETAATEAEKAKEGDAEKTDKDAKADAGKDTEKKSAAKKEKPERTIVVSASWEGEELYIGDVMTLKATLKGFENTEYTLQWQYSADNRSWTDVEGATSDTLDVTMTEENCLYYWRVNAVIAEDEAEEEAEAENMAETEAPTETEDAAAEEPVKTETPAAESTDAKSE